MNDFSLFTEHSVKKEQTKTVRLLKIVGPIVSVLLSAALSVLMIFVYGIELALLMFVVLLTVSLIICAKLTRTVSYDYRITEGELYFSEVYNGKRRKELFSLEISSLEAIAPYRDGYAESAMRASYSAVYDLTSSSDAEGVYYATYTSKEDSSSRILILFEPSEKMLKILKHHNRSTVIPR